MRFGSVSSNFNYDGNFLGRFDDVTDPEYLTLPTNPDSGDWFILNAGADLSSFTIDDDLTIDPSASDYFVAYLDGVWTVIDQDSGGSGSTCPAPMTITALRSLRNSGSLNKDCHYVITNYNRGTVGAATILLHAVDANTLSQTVMVKTTFDNTSWAGRYDIDSNRITELHDNLGNVVTGQEVVDTFPWGNTALTDNIILEAASFTYVAGTVTDNLIKTGSNVRLDTSGRAFQHNEVGEESNVTWTGGHMRENLIGADATVNNASTGDFENNQIVGLGAIVNTSGTAQFDNNYVGRGTSVTISGNANVNDNRMDTDSQVTVTGGVFYENEISGSSIVTTQAGMTRNVYNNRIGENSSIVLGNNQFFQNVVSQSNVNTSGSTGDGVRHCQLTNCLSLQGMQNIPTLDVAYLATGNNSQISANGAARLYVRHSTLENFGRILMSAGTQLDMNYCGFRDYSYAQVTQGRLYANYSTFAAIAYVQQASTGTNRIDRVDASSSSRIRFLNTSNNCRIYYSRAASESAIEHRGSSSGCYIYSCSADSSSSIFTNNSVNARMYYNRAHGASEISTQNMTGTHHVYYCVASARGYIRMQNGRGRMYAVHVSAQSIVTINGGTTSSRLYYSSFSAYYYLTLNATSLPGTRTALHGYGRRSYTPITAVPNGTFTQNF